MWKVWLLFGMLGVSAVLNVIALLPSVSFLELRGLLSPGPYSILKVIQLLWDHNLYPLVVLVVAFSVLFPPIKITLAVVALCRPMTQARRGRLLNTLGHLGRWSLLDVFVALLLLIITAKQSFTGSTVSFGLYAFVGAIMLSMTSVLILQESNRLKAKVRTSSGRPLVQTAGVAGWFVVPVVIAASYCLYAAVALPLFKVDKFGLMSNSWSLLEAIEQFRSQGLTLFAMIMATFLIVAPAVLAVASVVLLLGPMHRRHQVIVARVLHHIYEWCMLDVFLLAMMLYLTEESTFAPLNLKAGFRYLIIAMVLFHVVKVLVSISIRRGLHDDIAGAEAPSDG
jgi:paraquat-inducible protein A